MGDQETEVTDKSPFVPQHQKNNFSLLSQSFPPPVSATQSQSQVRTRTAGCHKHDADEGRTTLLGGGTALTDQTQRS